MVSSVADRVGVTERGAGPVVRPAWRRARLWVALAVVLLVGAIIATELTGGAPRPLDPRSSAKSGSKALAVLLAEYGAHVTRTTSVTTALRAGGTVLVAVPDAYTGPELALLRLHAARLVVVAPAADSLRRLSDGARPAGVTSGRTDARCDWPGAVAAGAVDLPDATTQYVSGSAQSCYGGAVLIGGRLVVLGSPELLQNRHLADAGVAALDVNAITDNRAAREITWLLPGTEATGTGAPTVWQLFPDGARRAFAWLLVLGVLLVLWQGRRFGPVVTEPLPVLVRSAEVVEGHGRLYRRAGARDRAAAALRAAAAARLGARFGLQRGAGLPALVAALTPATGRSPADLTQLLGGAPPGDDAALLRLAAELDAVEAAAGVPPGTKGTTT
jgi:hypothetical protein